MTAVVDTAITPDPSNRHTRGHQTLRDRLGLDERRRLTADLVLSHVPVREIAAQLGVGRTTVYDDIAAVRRSWQERAAQKWDAHVAEMNAKLDMLEAVLVPHVLADELDAIDRYLRVLERRAKLLGLDQPFRAEIELTDGRSTVDEAIEQLHAQIEARSVIDVP